MSKNTNSALNDAKRNKRDEFYTQVVDVQRELEHYRKQFRDKTVLLNCDDHVHSAFHFYFTLNFRSLGLRRLISTSYGFGKVTVIDNVVKGKIKHYGLEGDGDFRSPECVEFLKEADIVVTNPPFSLFQEFVAQLIEYDKKFLILGNHNALTNRVVWEHIYSGNVWLGVDNYGNKWFRVPDDYKIKTESRMKIENGSKYISMGNAIWLTNLEHGLRKTPLELTKKFNFTKYPQYDNFQAINVDRVKDIPCNYPGYMGVPISFLAKHCPEQFRIIGMTRPWKNNGLEFLRKPYPTYHTGYVMGRAKYDRIIIKRVR